MYGSLLNYSWVGMILSFAHASAELSIALDLGSVGQSEGMPLAESSPVVMIGHDEKESTGQSEGPLWGRAVLPTALSFWTTS